MTLTLQISSSYQLWCSMVFFPAFHLTQCSLYSCFSPSQCLIHVESTVGVNLLEMFSEPYHHTKPQLGYKSSFCSFCQYYWRVVQSKSLAWMFRGFNYRVKFYSGETRSASQTCLADELQITFGFMLGWENSDLYLYLWERKPKHTS